MSNYVLDKTYTVGEAAGIPAHRVVIVGVEPNSCRLPLSANHDLILGASVAAQDREGAGITVRKLGIALVEAAGAITAGAHVNIAGSSGRVKTIDEPSGDDVYIAGQAETAAAQAGDIVEVFLLPHMASSPQ